MNAEARQYLLARPPEPGSSGREDLEEFAAWFQITLTNSTLSFLRTLPTLESPYIAFLSCLTALDILSGYRHGGETQRARFRKFIAAYMPAPYAQHADVLLECRNTVTHHFSPGRRVVLVHKSPDLHLQPLDGKVVLCADVLAADLAVASDTYFDDVRKQPALLTSFRKRARRTAGGTMVQVFKIPGIRGVFLRRP